MKTKRMLIYMLSVGLGALLALPLMAQNTNIDFGEIESKQNEIENLYVDIYEIIDQYPSVAYNYIYEDGDLSKVTVTGITDEQKKKELEVLLINLNNLRQEIVNFPNRVGVFYMTEKEPKPKEGYRDFYMNLYSNITYPESATDNGVEGTVFVKFVVDHDGKVKNVIAAEDIDAPYESIVKDMRKEAKAAVKMTSGNWEPASIGGAPVAQWVVLPVQFKIENRPFSRSL